MSLNLFLITVGIFFNASESIFDVCHFPSSAEGQPPSILSLAYRAIRSDNPRQLRDHLAVIGEATLQSVEGAGLLGEACECGSDGCVRVLLDSGCPPNTSNRADGMSAMHLATQNDHAWSVY